MNQATAMRYLGWLNVLLWGGLAVTGLLLVFFYEPRPEAADWFRYKPNDSAVTNTYYVDTGLWPTTFSGWLQDVHLWLGVGAVFSTLLTVLVSMGGDSRRVTSFVIMVLTIVAFGVGLLLPWDHLALWAVEAGVGYRGYLILWSDDVRFLLSGGVEIGVGTMQRWLIAHAVVIPVIAAIVVAAGRRRRSLPQLQP